MCDAVLSPRILISGADGKMSNYVRAVRAAGGTPVSGYCPPPDLSCAGLLLCGGGDLDPVLYGQPDQGSQPPDPARDQAELELFRAFYQAGRPILGVCRGMQIINVALGGTLLQDLGDVRRPSHTHPQADQVHPVRAQPGSLLHTLYGPRFSVNSSHHQAVDCPAPGLVLTLRAVDGVPDRAPLPPHSGGPVPPGADERPPSPPRHGGRRSHLPLVPGPLRPDRPRLFFHSGGLPVMNHAPLRILTGAAVLVLSVSLLTGAAVPVRSLPAASGEETVLARPSLQDPDTLARAVACQSLSYYRPELLDRYLAYGALWPELSPEDVVTRVNIGLDGTFYGDVSQAEEPESLSVLVNKYHPLPDGYVPRLHSLPARYAPSGGSLAPAAAAAFMRMADAAREDGITLYSVSAYRSYSYQDSLYRRYTAQDGVEADTYSARPGFSEHQTGLALDINTASRSAHFETTATYRWLIENCWRYGFILRYPEGREDITGFCFEPWHYRFVGRTLALQVRESGLTYDEFLARRAVDRPHTALCAGDMPLEAVPILLDGICWLPAQAVAAAFGRTAAISGDQLVLPAEEGSVVLTAGSLTGERDDRPFALSSLPFQWEGEFYLSLEDLCALLELTARREEGLISLIPRSAPSALLPEELPPIQPLPC